MMTQTEEQGSYRMNRISARQLLSTSVEVTFVIIGHGERTAWVIIKQTTLLTINTFKCLYLRLMMRQGSEDWGLQGPRLDEEIRLEESKRLETESDLE